MGILKTLVAMPPVRRCPSFNQIREFGSKIGKNANVLRIANGEEHFFKVNALEN